MKANTLAALGVKDAIDTHIHPWSIHDLPPVIQGAREARPDLAQDFSPPRVLETATANGFSGVLFVQARDPHEGSRAEAEFFVAAAKEHSQVIGCVIGIDLIDPTGTAELLDEFNNHRVVRSCRMIAPENSGVGILSDPRTKTTAQILGQRNLRLDLLIRSANPGQLAEGVALVTWLASHSDTVVIGDHLLKPTGVAEGTPSAEWLNALRELAACRNFYMKISGLPGEVPPGTASERFWPFFDAAFEAFGPDRLLFGSDYPVSYSHSGSVAAVTEWISSRGLLTGSVAQKIFSDTARRAYGCNH